MIDNHKIWSNTSTDAEKSKLRFRQYNGEVEVYKEIKSNEDFIDLIGTVKSLCKNQKLREELKINASKIIDDQGLKRVVGEIKKII